MIRPLRFLLIVVILCGFVYTVRQSSTKTKEHSKRSNNSRGGNSLPPLAINKSTQIKSSYTFQTKKVTGFVPANFIELARQAKLGRLNLIKRQILYEILKDYEPEKLARIPSEEFAKDEPIEKNKSMKDAFISIIKQAQAHIRKRSVRLFYDTSYKEFIDEWRKIVFHDRDSLVRAEALAGRPFLSQEVISVLRHVAQFDHEEVVRFNAIYQLRQEKGFLCQLLKIEPSLNVKDRIVEVLVADLRAANSQVVSALIEVSQDDSLLIKTRSTAIEALLTSGSIHEKLEQDYMEGMLDQLEDDQNE